MADPRRLRSLLFVPGDRPDMVAKVGRSGPDGVVLDLEDAVRPDLKAAARDAVVRALDSLEVAPGTLVLVRVNAPGTPWWTEDVAAVAGTRIDGVVLPKTERVGDLTALRAELDGHRRGDAFVVAGLETVRGVADAREILAVGAAEAGAQAAYFGAEDYVTDLGGRRTAGGAEVLTARSLVAVAGRLAGVTVLDQVVLAVHDEQAFRADAATARDLGYGGKLCLHPAQVGWAHDAFTPSEEELAHARAVLAAVDGAGTGVALVEGAMVDEVHVRMARATLARAAR